MPQPEENKSTFFFTDRSRQVAFQKCPRLRFWGSVYGGWGISPALPNLDMELGKAIHEGIAGMLDGKGLDEPLEASALSLREALSQSFPPALVDAYLQLQEGLLRAFWFIWYPRLSARFQIVGTPEQEMLAEIQPRSGILHMSRPDAILRDKSTGEYGTWSLKTSSFNDQAALELEYRTDTQGLSEIWAAEQYFNHKLSWAQMFFIHTGAKEVVEGGHLHTSPVYQGWFKDDGLGSVQLAHSYWWKDPMGKKKGLGQAWKRFNVAEMYEGGIERWITDLQAGKIQPEAGNPLEDIFFCPPANYRNPADIEEWKKSTLYQEKEIRWAAGMYNNIEVEDEMKDQILFNIFPQHRGSCIYMKRKCSMYQLCHGTAGEAEDPFSNGFKWREINHPQEKPKGEV